jgi:hypothetical protein
MTPSVSVPVLSVGALGERRRCRDGPGLVLDGKRFAGESRLVDQEVRRREHSAVGRHQIARGQDDDVAGNNGAGGHALLAAISKHATGER